MKKKTWEWKLRGNTSINRKLVGLHSKAKYGKNKLEKSQIRTRKIQENTKN